MKRGFVGLVVAAGALLASASAASASSISVTATASGSSVVAHVAGTADPCGSYCATPQVQVEVTPSDGYDTCIEPGNPQYTAPLPLAGGPFALTAAIPVAGGQAYAVCAYVVTDSYTITLPSAESNPAVVSVAPTACPPGAAHALYLAAPSPIAYRRRAIFSISGNNSGQNVANGTLTMRGLSDSKPFYTYTFTGGDLNNFNNDGGADHFYIELDRRDGSAQVTLTYQQDESDTSTQQCIDQRTAVVRAVAGHKPTAHLINSVSDDAGGVGIGFSAPGGCALTTPTPVQITVRGSGAASTLSTPDECWPGTWRVRGHTPSVSTTRSLTASGSIVEFHSAGHRNRTYQVTVRVAGRVVRRGRLENYYDSVPPTRVFEGTDQFVNYCIDQSKTVYSYHLRLFCWLPGSTYQWVDWR